MRISDASYHTADGLDIIGNQHDNLVLAESLSAVFDMVLLRKRHRTHLISESCYNTNASGNGAIHNTHNLQNEVNPPGHHSIPAHVARSAYIYLRVNV